MYCRGAKVTPVLAGLVTIGDPASDDRTPSPPPGHPCWRSPQPPTPSDREPAPPPAAPGRPPLPAQAAPPDAGQALLARRPPRPPELETPPPPGPARDRAGLASPGSAPVLGLAVRLPFRPRCPVNPFGVTSSSSQAALVEQATNAVTALHLPA